MYILTRYVVWEVLKLFLAALAALTLIFAIVMGAQRGILQEGLPPLIVLRCIPVILPEMLGITIPVAMLYSVSSVFGRMTGANEVVALKSLGISPMAVVWPVLVLAAFLSLGTVWMYEIAATWGRPSFARIVGDSIEKIAYSRLQAKGFCDCDLFSATVKRVDERDGKRFLVQPTITVKGRPKVTITASEAELHTNAGMLEIECRDSEVNMDGVGRMSYPGKYTLTKPLPPPKWDPRHRDWVAMKNIPGLIVDIQAEIDRLRRNRRSLEKLREAHKALGVPAAGEDAEQIAGQINQEIADKQLKIYRLRAETYRRWACGFTCLCFALIGTPVAMLWRHADGLTNFFVCFLPILALYYPLLMFGEDLSTSGALPPISFWMGNVILVCPAVVLLRWVVRH